MNNATKSRKAKQPTEYPTWAAAEITKSDFADELDVVLGMVQPEYLHDAMIHLGLAIRAANDAQETVELQIKQVKQSESLIRGLHNTIDLLRDHLARLNETMQDDNVSYDLRKVDYVTSAWTEDALLERMEAVLD